MAESVKRYGINLIRRKREAEKKAEKQQRIAVLVSIASAALFALAVAYSGYSVWKMERVLDAEKEKLSQLRREYQKYQTTRMIVEKADVELLNKLQGRGIFWTKKLAAIAKYLPENYLITHFQYRETELRVSGYGIVNPQQDELLILDGFLNRLRGDSTFASTFPTLYLNMADKNQTAGRVQFEFSALTAGDKKKKKKK